MKQLSEAQVNLIECLKYLKIKEESIVVIMLTIPKDEQIAEMADYLLKNPKTTESEILKQAVVISERIFP